jgi:hypothetical protein
VTNPLRGLVSDTRLKQRVEEVLDLVLAYGDLIEARDITSEDEQRPPNLLYAAPPSFVMRKNGGAILLGVTPEQNSCLPDRLEAAVEYLNHVRRIPAGVSSDLGAELGELGLIELPPEGWLRKPLSEQPNFLLERLDSLLESGSAAGEIPGLKIIDPSKSVRFYPERWDEPKRRTGRFIGRRPRAYGADVWCYVELESGNPTRLLDLPLEPERNRGCDEAWHAQMALDAVRASPQIFRVRKGIADHQILDLFSPVPRWAQRRWDILGSSATNSGCLFSYSLRSDEMSEEIEFARQMLWLEMSTAG